MAVGARDYGSWCLCSYEVVVPDSSTNDLHSVAYQSSVPNGCSCETSRGEFLTTAFHYAEKPGCLEHSRVSDDAT